MKLLSPDPKTRLGSAQISLGATLVHWFVKALGRTWRIDVVEGAEHLAAFEAGVTPAILNLWHDRAVLGACLASARWHGKGVDVTVLASDSRDGELVARVVTRWGGRVVRGSSRRGGSKALWGTYKAIARHGSSPIVVPDGPVGPRHELKPGVLMMARRSGAPLLMIGLAADRCWRLRSWDRLIIPKPFARLTVCLATPQAVPSDLDDEATEFERCRLESLLNDVTRRAEEAVA